MIQFIKIVSYGGVFMVDRTKTHIVQAFNRLISKMDFEHITAIKIADEANISKATFYRYFKDKYEVMNYNYKSLLDQLLQLESCKDYRTLFYHLFYVAEKEWSYLRHAFSTVGVNSFSNFIFEYSRMTVLTITKMNRNGSGFTSTEELQIDVFCNGICYMYTKWTFGKYRCSASESADALFELMPETLRYYWFL